MAEFGTERACRQQQDIAEGEPMRNSKAILDRLVDELGDALELDRGADSTFKAHVYQGLLRAQQAMGTCSVELNLRTRHEVNMDLGSSRFSVGQQQPGTAMTSQRSPAHNPLEDEDLITAHSQLRQVFRNGGQTRLRRPSKLLA